MKIVNLMRRYEACLSWFIGEDHPKIGWSLNLRAHKYLMNAFVSQELILAGILVNEARLGRNGYFKTSPKELRLARCFQMGRLWY